MASRVPAELTAAVERIMRMGMTVAVIRRPAELADALRPNEAVLALADGVLVATPVLREVATRPAPAVLAVARDTNQARIERIDAEDHWAGVALVDATLLENTLAMLGDWDLQSTLLRRAVQARASRITLPVDAGAHHHALIAGGQDAHAHQGALLAAQGVRDGPWLEAAATRWLARPLVAMLSHARGARMAAGVSAAVLALLALSGLATGWSLTGAALLLAALLAASVAELWARYEERPAEARRIRSAAAGVAIGAPIALAFSLGVTTAWLLMGFGLAMLALAWRANALERVWSPSPLAIAVALLAGAVLAAPLIGLALIALHALIATALGIEALRNQR